MEHASPRCLAPNGAASGPAAEATELVALFRRWLDLSELNRRAFVALTQEVNVSAGLVENGVVDLVACFGSLASALTTQQRCIDGIVGAGASCEPRRSGQLLADLETASSQVSRIVDRLVMCIQFQDRTNQHLRHVSDTLSVLGSAATSLQTETQERVAGLGWEGGLDETWQDRILSGHTLAAVRERFVGGLLAPAPGLAEAVPAEGAMCAEGSVDLF